MKNICLFFVFLAVLLALTACPADTVAVTGVSLNNPFVGLFVGSTEKLTAIVLPDNATNKNVTWSSSDAAVATVSATGLVTGINAGTATITVTTVDGNKTTSCYVTVSNVAVTGVSLDKTSASLLVGNTETLNAVVKPDNATNKNVTWSSSNDAVATVSATGLVTGISAGTATVTVTTEDGNMTASCTVTVSNAAVSVTGVSLNKTSASFIVGNTETLYAVVEPNNATNKNVTWSSSDAAIATVSATGVVSGVSVGTATVTVTTADGNKTASCVVTVSPVSVTGVSLTKASTSLLAGNTETLYAVVEPDNATNKNVTWSSGNPAIATVSATGLVTGISAGTAIVTVTTEDGNETASCTVTVSNTAVHVTGVSLNKTSASLVFGSTVELTATITPNNATNQNITWNSSNVTVADVSSGGLVTAKSAGTATITVTAADGNITASCNVTVIPKAITFDVDPIPEQTYNRGSALIPAVIVRDGSTLLTLTTHYTVSYSNNINAGTANVTISGAGNYAGSSGSITFTINKAAGAAVSAPTGASSVTSNSITITAVTTPNTGQSVEYAKNTANSAPSTGWQDGTTFNGLNLNTAYYIFARSKGNDNYNTGTASAGLRVNTSTLVEMVNVPNGNFQMGQELGTAGSGDTTPVHKVTLYTGFKISKYPITQEQYQALMGSNPSNFSSNPASGEVQGKRPVEQVNWYEAIEFCNALSTSEGLTPYYTINKVNKDPNNSSTTDSYKWTVTPGNSSNNGYRLPSEAQWEYAAKGGSPGNYTYSGSDTIGDVAWYDNNSDGKTHEAGKKAPNGLGIYDMSGNVLEWCFDWHESYTNVAQYDPLGSGSGDGRVVRGGSLNLDASYARSVYRAKLSPHTRNNNLGFRIVRPL